jgi:hypothetical protein
MPSVPACVDRAWANRIQARPVRIRNWVVGVHGLCHTASGWAHVTYVTELLDLDHLVQILSCRREVVIIEGSTAPGTPGPRSIIASSSHQRRRAPLG